MKGGERERDRRIYRRRNGRRDLATFQLTNCKYLDCGCRMTLINIADGTEGECRSKGGWRRSLSAARRTSRGRQLERDRDGRGWREGEKGVTGGERWERGRVEGMVWVFIISPSRLDSVKLWNNPLMSLPCRVDRMPTKLPDFPLFLPALSFPSFLPSLSPISLSLSLLFQRHPPLPQTHPTPLFAALHSSEAGIPIIAGLVSLYDSLYAPWTA